MSTRKVAVKDLQFGMYVSELDRPWVGTPFLFQGFEISNQQELDQLRECCDYVYILTEQTTNLSIEKHRITPPPSIRFETSRINITTAKRAPPSVTPSRFVGEMQHIKTTYDDAHCYIRDVMADMRLGRSIDTAKAKGYVDQLVESIVRNDSALTLLAQLKSRDEYTVQHSINVCILSLLLAKFMGLPDNELRELGVGALLHDIGKMHIPDEVLNKEGPLSDEEFALMKGHPEAGYQLLLRQGGISLSAMEVVRSHHERMDGKGYPRGLAGGQISRFPQLVSLIDVYDAITTQRCYHQALSPHEALKQMFENHMGAFPNELMHEFIQCLSIFPVGSIVELSNGEVGVVLSINREYHLSPMVLVVLDAEKQPLDRYRLINLSFMGDRGVDITISRILESWAYGIDAPKILREQGDFAHFLE